MQTLSGRAKRTYRWITSLAGAAEELGVSEEVINLSVTLFVVGFGVGPLLFAPREAFSS